MWTGKYLKEENGTNYKDGIFFRMRLTKLLICIEWICCMQLKELNSQGYEIVLVTSGAIGLGRQRLRYRNLVNSRFALKA